MDHVSQTNIHLTISRVSELKSHEINPVVFILVASDPVAGQLHDTKVYIPVQELGDIGKRSFVNLEPFVWTIS